MRFHIVDNQRIIRTTALNEIIMICFNCTIYVAIFCLHLTLLTCRPSQLVPSNPVPPATVKENKISYSQSIICILGRLIIPSASYCFISEYIRSRCMRVDKGLDDSVQLSDKSCHHSVFTYFSPFYYIINHREA